MIANFLIYNPFNAYKITIKRKFFLFFYVSFTKETTFYPKQTLINSTSNKENLIWNIMGAPSGISENTWISRKKINKSIKLVR